MSWDHDACVNDPVSGHVWEDVLRHVAVWSYRCDMYAARLERVCRRWKHFWQVAEGVFDVDLRAGRLNKIKYVFRMEPYTLFTMLDVKRHREKERLNFLTEQFAGKTVGLGCEQTDEARARQQWADEVASNKRALQAAAGREREMILQAIGEQCRGLLPDPPRAQLSEFAASWPSGRLGSE